MKRENQNVEGVVCGRCGSKNMKRVFMKKKQKYTVVCQECRSSDPVLTCVECHSSNIEKDEKRAEIYCRDCGLVLARPFYSLGSHSYPIIEKHS